MEKNFIVDREKCSKCAMCYNDCLTGAIEKDMHGCPIMNNPQRCIECQHCLAICPNGAISILNKLPEEAQQIKQINSEDVLNLIQSRRSVRNFKRDDVDKDTIEKLKNMLNYTPTGCNSHKLHFSIIEESEVMDDFRCKVNSDLINLLKSRPAHLLGEKISKFSKYQDALINGEDVIFRGAPHLIVACAPVDSPCPQQDGIIALSYFELYANSLKLGTLWCGFAQAVLKIFPTYCDYLEIPKGYMPVYVMLFGYPNVKYARTTKPKEYSFSKVSAKENVELDLFSKTKRIFWNFIR